MSHSTPQDHPSPAIGFCCSNLTELSNPTRPCCAGSILSMLPIPTILHALSTQHLAAAQRSEIHVLPSTPEFTHIIRNCGWFVAFGASALPPSSSPSNTFFTLAHINNSVGCVQLPYPFDCGVAWQKVDEFRQELLCPTTRQIFGVQVWADPVLLGAQVLVGEAVSGQVGGGGGEGSFLCGQGFDGRPPSR